MKKAFEADTGRVLNIVINSLYSEKEIFLRELISNSSDALDKRRFLSLTDKNDSVGTEGLKIEIHANKKDSTLLIKDNGVGMSKEELENSLGTIAKSGTTEFLAELEKNAVKDKKKKDVNLIGQFGVGFYSAFMVADKVEVVSKGVGQTKANKWESDGISGYEISDATKERITSLVKDVIGYDEDRGDSLTVSSSPFVATLEGINLPWYEKDWIQKALTQSIMVILLGIVTFGVLRPLVNRIIVPIDAGRPGEPLSGTDDDEVDLDKVTVQEGETLEDIKAKLKPKKQTISAEMLDTANTYDDKVAVIRMIVSDEAGRVSNVFKTMMKKDIEV